MVAVVEDAAARGRLLQWKLTATSRPVTAWAAAVKGCWHWPWQKLSWAGVATVTWMTPLVNCRGHHLVEPDAVERRVLHPHGRQHPLPEVRVERGRRMGGVPDRAPVGGEEAVAGEARAGVRPAAVRRTDFRGATDHLSRRRVSHCHGEAG